MNIIFDINNSTAIPHTTLTKIHRQATKSGIITLSTAVRNSQLPIITKETLLGELEDMHVIPYDDKVDDRAVEVYLEMVKKYGSTKDVQLLTPVKSRGYNCVNNFNKLIQEQCNPEQQTKSQIILLNSDKSETTYRIGDKVMCIKNNYHIHKKGAPMNEINEDNKIPIFNGWSGMITDINVLTEEVTIKFELSTDEVTLTPTEMKELITLGYASTVHKYQGSQAKCIIGVIDYTTPPMMLTKELIYTLLTRAERECWLFENSRALKQASMYSGVRDKNTFLGEFLR